MEKFRQVLEDCDLHDPHFVGDAFTWRNHHHDVASYIKERLDRAVANSAWRCLFSLVCVENGDPRHSDHRPIIVDVLERESKWCEQPRVVVHKFEARWLDEEDCATRVEEAWMGALEEGEVSMMEIQKRCWENYGDGTRMFWEI